MPRINSRIDLLILRDVYVLGFGFNSEIVLGGYLNEKIMKKQTMVRYIFMNLLRKNSKNKYYLKFYQKATESIINNVKNHNPEEAGK